jgi:hypothetical protein
VGSLDKRIEALERLYQMGGDPVEIRVMQEGPPGREHEAEYLYSIIMEPCEGGGWKNTEVYRPEAGAGD